MSVLNTYDSRLQASEYAWRWRFSNPSSIGFGVDQLYENSNQNHWFITCSHCGHAWYIDFEHGYNNHYLDVDRSIYACGKCNEEITDKDRRNGEWVAKYPTRERHGYWFSQLMAPWVSAKRIIEQKNDSSPEFFYNFVLGKAYTPSDLVVNRESILRACSPGIIPRVNVSIGVDQNAQNQIWVAMTPQGVFGYGKTSSWEEIETLKLMYNATVVCDPAPYSVQPKMYAEKYPDWYLCYFKESTSMDVITWKGQVVNADRVRLLDTVASEINNAKLLFRQHPAALEEYIGDWANLYRTNTENSDGKTKSDWMKRSNKQSDFSFATCLVAGTLITTDQGTKPIETIIPGDMVLTRDGYKPVTEAGFMGIKEVMRLTATDGSDIIGTLDHRVYTENRGFVPMRMLTHYDILSICKGKRKKSTLTSMENATQDTPIPQSATIVSTSPALQFLNTCSIKPSGYTIMERYLKDMLSTTKTLTRSIINTTTSFVLQDKSIRNTMSPRDLPNSIPKNEKRGLNGISTALKLLLSLRFGSIARLVEHFSLIPSSMRLCLLPDSLSVNAVEKNTWRRTQELTMLAVEPVTIGSTCSPMNISTLKKGVAQSVEKPFKPLNGERIAVPVPKSVQVSRLVYLNRQEAVYNLSVKGKPEFYANGILVHNCYARIGLSRILGGTGSNLMEPEAIDPDASVSHEAKGFVEDALQSAVEKTFAEIDE